ncbi:MAG TPA: efflux RND transporter periplasmic adaptor subunit [Vicinamibacterales bacterium]|nr:efflux RND transporter periplasmic adaptor subunit [Vicinamibacterales bacterium]
MATHRAGTCLVIAAAAFTLGTACRKAPPTAPPPPEVYVTDVAVKDVPVYLELAGQTEGFEDVDIRARVEGFLESVDFREGSFVRKGDLLYRIDPKPFEASLAGSKADLATAEARLDKAANDVKRYAPLAALRAVSQQELDDARSAQEAARSQVDAARAAVETSTLNLGYTRVTSPIAGLVGTTQVKPGNLVGRGEPTLLTTVSRIDPVIFKVGVTEADYLRVVRSQPGQTGKDPRAGGIELTLADGTVHRYPGHVTAVERQVNAATGTIGIQIVLPNPQYVLRPGQFGRARILLDTKKNALLVPQRAVQELQSIYSVAVVDDGNKVTFRNVTVGPRVGDRWVVEQGLEPGDRVVAEGLQAIGDGMVVRVKPMGEPGVPEAVATGGKQH